MQTNPAFCRKTPPALLRRRRYGLDGDAASALPAAAFAEVWEGGGGEEQERAGDVEGCSPAAAGLGQDVGTVVFDAQRVCRCSKTGVISAEGHAVCQRDGILRDRHGYGNVRVEKPVRDLRLGERVGTLGQLSRRSPRSTPGPRPCWIP